MIQSRDNDPGGRFLSTRLPYILVTLGILVTLAVLLLLVQWAFIFLFRSAEEQTVASDALLADFDGDGDLDLLAGGARSGLNDGAARFSAADQRIDYASREALALGDVTGDGIADLLIASPDAYQLWQGQGDATFVPGSSTAID